jgi:hypothetical protein
MKGTIKVSIFILSILALLWLGNFLVDNWYPEVSEVRQNASVMGYNELQQPVPTNTVLQLQAKFPGKRAIHGDRFNMSLIWVGDRALRLIALEIVDEGAQNKTTFSRVLDPPTHLQQFGRIDLVWSIGQPTRRTVKVVAYFDDNENDPRYLLWLNRANTDGVGAYSINGTRYPDYIASVSFNYVAIDQFASERILVERVVVSGIFAVFPFLALLQFGGRLGIEDKISLSRKRQNRGVVGVPRVPAAVGFVTRPPGSAERSAQIQVPFNQLPQDAVRQKYLRSA